MDLEDRELDVETVAFRAVFATVGSGPNLHKSMAERDWPAVSCGGNSGGRVVSRKGDTTGDGPKSKDEAGRATSGALVQ